MSQFNGPQPHPGVNPGGPGPHGPGPGFGGPGGPAPHGGYPQDPPKKKKGAPLGLLIGGGAGLLILVLVAAIFIPMAMKDRGKEAVEKLFAALSESDARTATMMTVDLTYGITDEMLRQSNEVAPLELKSVSNEGNDRYNIVFMLGDQEYRSTVRTVEEYSTVKVDDVTTNVSFDAGENFMGVAMNGLDVYSEQEVFPGVYQLTVSDNENVALNPSRMTIDLSEPSTQVELEALASDAGKEAAKEAIVEHLDDCMKWSSNNDELCPTIKEPPGHSITRVTWNIDTAKMKLTETNPSAGTYGGTVTVPASATYTEYDERYNSTEKSIDDTFEMELYVNLNSTAPHVVR